MLGCAGPWCSPAEALNAPLWENPQGTAQPCSLSIHSASPKHHCPVSTAVPTSLKTKCASLHRCSRTDGIPRNARSSVLFPSSCLSCHCLQISTSSCHCPNCIPWPPTGKSKRPDSRLVMAVRQRKRMMGGRRRGCAVPCGSQPDAPSLSLMHMTAAQSRLEESSTALLFPHTLFSFDPIWCFMHCQNSRQSFSAPPSDADRCVYQIGMRRSNGLRANRNSLLYNILSIFYKIHISYSEKLHCRQTSTVWKCRPPAIHQ